MNDLEARATEVANILKLLAHPKRLIILCELSKWAKTVTEIQSHLRISQSQISQFLARMKRNGLVQSERVGMCIKYSISDAKISHILIELAHTYCNPSS